MAKAISAMGKIYGNRMYYSGWTEDQVPERWREDAKAYYEQLKAENEQ